MAPTWAVPGLFNHLTQLEALLVVDGGGLCVTVPRAHFELYLPQVENGRQYRVRIVQLLQRVRKWQSFLVSCVWKVPWEMKMKDKMQIAVMIERLLLSHWNPMIILFQLEKQDHLPMSSLDCISRGKKRIQDVSKRFRNSSGIFINFLVIDLLASKQLLGLHA